MYVPRLSSLARSQNGVALKIKEIYNNKNILTLEERREKREEKREEIVEKGEREE